MNLIGLFYLVTGSKQIHSFLWEHFQMPQLLGIVVFVIASYQQFTAHKVLGNARKSNSKCFFTYIFIISSFSLLSEPQNKGRYFVARGGLFDYVSCPNFLCETIIYLSLYAIAGVNHYPWALITAWVLVNQVY